MTQSNGARVLQFSNFGPDREPIKARCSQCGREFVGLYVLPKERTDDVLLKIRADFDAHECGKLPYKKPIVVKHL